MIASYSAPAPTGNTTCCTCCCDQGMMYFVGGLGNIVVLTVDGTRDLTRWDRDPFAGSMPYEPTIKPIKDPRHWLDRVVPRLGAGPQKTRQQAPLAYRRACY